jgi:hypothetical protein
MSKLLSLTNKQIEEIWETMKHMLSYQQCFLKNSLLDVVLLNVIYLVCSLEERKEIKELRTHTFEASHIELKKDYNEILCKFHGISHYTNFNLFEFAYEKANQNFNKNDTSFLKEFITKYKNNYEIVNNKHEIEENKISHETLQCMQINCSYMSYLLNLQEDYSVILSISPNKSEPLSSISPIKAEFINNKRIRPLTPPLVNKTITSSPYKTKSSYIPFSSSNISAFKDLNNAFSFLSKRGDS